jgi:uncharacterized integral membrane protein
MRRWMYCIILGSLAAAASMVFVVLVFSSVAIHPPPGKWPANVHLAVGILASGLSGCLLALCAEDLLARLAHRINEWLMKGRP